MEAQRNSSQPLPQAPRKINMEEKSKQLRKHGYQVTEEYDNTGLSKVSGNPPPLKPWFGRPRWDWLQVGLQFIAAIALPATLFFATQAFSSQQTAANQRAAQDQQHEAALQSYLDHMSDLLLGNNTGKGSPSLASAKSYDEISNVARVRTLTVLQGLDGPSSLDGYRKGAIIEFLYNATLIGLEGQDSSGIGHYFSPIVILSGADLTNIDLKQFALRGIDLSGTDLTGAHISSDLGGANFSEANLSSAVITDNLPDANFQSANLSKATLSGDNLASDDFSNANLSGANMSNAQNLSQQQLNQANSCIGAILPKGLTCNSRS